MLFCTVDFFRAILSAPKIIPDIIQPALPYALDVALFGAFVIWNGGIVLGLASFTAHSGVFPLNRNLLISGDKSNHVPSLHIPQVYYFIGFATLFGWPALIGGPGGAFGLMKDVRSRMFGSKT